MSDRELLELAAKAAGIELAEQIAESGWNPLTDDGDAFRLAVNLGICIDTTDGVHVMYVIDKIARPISEWEFEDIYVATRRAIVRAAAEIGKDRGAGKGDSNGS